MRNVLFFRTSKHGLKPCLAPFGKTRKTLKFYRRAIIQLYLAGKEAENLPPPGSVKEKPA
jgi:hypothetical protein